ncbi:MAG: DUF2497 domain-containing protein [Sphingopyxis sp.]
MGDLSREPSMEEILSSIRRVIARDDSARYDPAAAELAHTDLKHTDLSETFAQTAPFPTATPMAADGADDADDVLELTDGDCAAPAAPPAATMPMDAAFHDGAITSQDAAMPEATPMPTPHTATAHTAADALVSPVSAAASRQSLDALAALLTAETESAPAHGADISVAAMVESSLKPMLKAWLDAHLPAMVERLVAQEIARITNSKA